MLFDEKHSNIVTLKFNLVTSFEKPFSYLLSKIKNNTFKESEIKE